MIDMITDKQIDTLCKQFKTGELKTFPHNVYDFVSYFFSEEKANPKLVAKMKKLVDAGIAKYDKKEDDYDFTIAAEWIIWPNSRGHKR